MVTRFGLKPRILLFTVLPLVTLAFAALWIVNGTTTRQVDRGIRDDLGRASAVLENVLSENERSLVTTGLVIVRDPRFFSALTIPGVAADRQARATVEGVARDFDTLTRSDVFEVVDARGRLLASVGRDSTERSGREALVHEALGGRAVTRVLAHDGAHHLVCVAPAVAGGRVVGALVLGTRIGSALASRLQELTRSEVTFVSAGAVTGTTLTDSGDRQALVHALAAAPADGALPMLHGSRHQYVTLARPLPHAAASGQWYVMQRALDEETAFLRSIQARLVELGVLALIVALIAGFMIAQRITGPVLRLVRGAEAMERGDFDVPVDCSTGDEIATLATSFDGMRRRQREYIRTLEESGRIRKEFIDVASHELATPLTLIRSWQEMMADGTLGPLTTKQQHAIDVTLTEGVGRLEQIAANATRIRDAENARGAIAPEDCDVGALVDQALTEAAAAAGARRVEMTSRVADGLEAHVDGPKVVTALVQLLTNGVRFTPDGGRVEVRAQLEGDVLAIEVRDTGVGIAPERIAGLLDGTLARPESRNHHSSSTLEFDSAGMGLGLQVVRAVAAAHGGRLTCMSAPGAGTTFALRLPAAADAADADTTERRAA